MLAWRLPWTFACTRHHLLLVDTCPVCGRAHRPALDQPPRDPGRCDTTGLPLPSHPRGRQPPACTVPLTGTATIPLDPHGPVLAAQRHVDQLIEALAHAQPAAATSQHAPAARQGLDDLHAAARAALLALTAPPPPPKTVTAVLAELDADGSNAPAGPAHTGDRRRRTTDTAAGVTIAHLMLAGQPGDPDPAITDWLIDVAVHKGQTSPKLLLRRWENTRPELHAALLHRLAPHLNITYQMRYSTAGAQPRRPQAGHARARAAAVPSLFWRGWALRLNPSGLFDSLTYRTTLSALLLLAGTDNLSYRDAIKLLGRPLTPGSQPTLIVTQLRDAGVLDTVTTVLDQLAVALDTHGSPIDYGRRRRWKRLTNPDFDEHAWRRQCAQTRARRLASPRPTTFARLYLAELLTGIHPHHLPPPARLPATDRPHYANFVRRLPTPLDDYLHHQGRRILARTNIREPLEWEPPIDWISPVTWPGPDPASTPRGDQWARTPGRTPADTPIDPPHPPSTEQLRAYVAQGLGPRQIAKATGCPPPLINQLLTHAGLTRPAPRDILATLDPAWLRHEYEHKHRALHAIAAELGIHGKDLSLYARGIGIHIRHGARDRHALGAHGGPDAFPPTIWAAFTGFRAEQRIRRLLAAPGHTSLNEAARALGTKQPNLIVQIRRLEHAVGAELLHHGPEHSPITLTAAGEQFARDVQPVLALLDRHRIGPDRKAEKWANSRQP